MNAALQILAKMSTDDLAYLVANLNQVVIQSRKWEIVCEMGDWDMSELQYWAPDIVSTAEDVYRERYAPTPTPPQQSERRG